MALRYKTTEDGSTARRQGERIQAMTITIATEAHPKRPCPVCGAQVVTRNVAGAVMLDYHLDARRFKQWCAGSDMNLSEVEDEPPADE